MTYNHIYIYLVFITNAGLMAILIIDTFLIHEGSEKL